MADQILDRIGQPLEAGQQRLRQEPDRMVYQPAAHFRSWLARVSISRRHIYTGLTTGGAVPIRITHAQLFDIPLHNLRHIEAKRRAKSGGIPAKTGEIAQLNRSMPHSGDEKRLVRIIVHQVCGMLRSECAPCSGRGVWLTPV